MTTVAVLISTCDRPEGLRLLLEALLPQAKALQARVIIVDNGLASAEDVVRNTLPPDVATYRRLAESGLAVSRNCALQLALTFRPDYLAFIDDDEVPERTGWKTCSAQWSRLKPTW